MYYHNDLKVSEEHKKSQYSDFNPYAMNGGSVVAIAGADYAIIGADTRLSVDFSIYSRKQDKLFQLTKTAVLGVTRCWSDALTLSRTLQSRVQIYQQDHSKDMSTPALAQMLATMLYYKRFFPYYVTNILAGLDDDGKGCVFSYDPLGHCERSSYKSEGTAGTLLQPLLDNQAGFLNMKNVEPRTLCKEKAMTLLKDSFISAAERDVYTGDGINIKTITLAGIEQETFPLRKD